MEETVKFTRLQDLLQGTFLAGVTPCYDGVEPAHLPPLVLAYVGDAAFSLYVRVRLLAYQQNHVQVLHTHGARLVSAAMQAAAVRGLEDVLTEAEKEWIRRGRNTTGHVPRHAKVADYRYATGWETLLGYLLLSGQQERLAELCRRAFDYMVCQKTEDAQRERNR